VSSVLPVVGADVLRQVKAIELRTKHLVGNLLTGEYRSVFRGHGIEFAEVRAYEQGDDYRSIDWNVSARMGSPYIKLFDEERELTLLLIVDRSGSVEFGDPVHKSRIATEVAAVLALAAARNNDRVGALIFSETVDHIVAPAKGRRHALRVIRDLITFQPVATRTNVAGVLGYASKLLSHRSIVVVISDFRDDNWETQLRNLSARHDVVAITVDDPREMDLPEVGWVELEDAETGDRVLVDTTDSEARLRVRIAAEETRLRRARALEHSGADHLSLRTDRPYDKAMHETFARRARRFKR
jgi:uncharacterized protein (DUF58 family)